MKMNFVQKVKIRFLSRPFFTLCITMEVEPRIAKLYKWHNSCFCNNYIGKVDGGWKKKCLHRFSHDQKIANVWPE